MSRANRKGFTLLETVVALALCAMVAGAVSTSLTTALRAERQAARLRALRLTGNFLPYALRTEGGASNLLAEVRLDWQLTSSLQTTGVGSNQAAWAVWEYVRVGDSSLRGRIALHQ